MISFALAALAVAADPVSFEEAKKDPAKRGAYLQQLLGPLLLDKKLVKGWYVMTEEAHVEKDCRCAKCANEAIRAEYKTDEREFAFRREIKEVLKPLEKPSSRVVPFYRGTTLVGYQEKQGILLIGDLFALASEDEVKSVVEDYVTTFVKLAEDGVKIGERSVDTTVPAMDSMKYDTVLMLWAQAAQLAPILSGKRKVSEDFKKAAVADYLATYGKYGKAYLRQKKIWDDNNENTLQKEILDSMDVLRATVNEKMKVAGYQHKLVSADEQKFELEPAK